ncbi:GAP1-N2 domain-containing protein [Sphaerisporangium fuscum]|uniref:GAP1-N2 domain-containing protein n=1 Tax=Sphaerisporangium fuscum TaxID=2835868 RepID=UPI001BDD59ED|nr:hypothetical protein [Sphaerisporangium fuscum]
MAWQLHYTSAEAGTAGRAGFQFVARSPGLPHGLADQVAAFLTYRPPPAAPLAPTPDEITAFPVALGYGRVGAFRVLTRCVYLGRDYSGRYGNFLGHAVVAGPGELTGLRPVELWRSPVWSDAPASPGSDLPELSDLAPGDHLDPEWLSDWLSRQGEAAYARLGALLSTVCHTLARGHGRVVLVCPDVEEIVRWIAVISYSLPWPVAARLPFLTYSADPATASQVIVGTTPDVWLPSDVEAAVVRLDVPDGGPGAPPGRFARTIADCWRRTDLEGIDAIGELSGHVPPETEDGRARPETEDRREDGGGFDPESGAALLAFCRGDPGVTAEEQSAVARALSPGLPEWIWHELGRASERMGFELASAARALAPADVAERCAARCAVLALRDRALPAPPPARRDETRDALRPEAARAVAAAHDLDEVGRVVRTAHAMGVPVAAEGLEHAARALARDGRGDLGRLIEGLPVELRESALGGALPGLEEATVEVRERMLTGAVCERLASRDLSATPRTGTAVVLSRLRHGHLSRADATGRLLHLAPSPDAADPDAGLPGEAGEWDEALGLIWEEAPGAAECADLVARLGPAMDASPHLRDLPARAFLAEGLGSPGTVRLAELVRDRVPGYPSRDAEAVLLAAAAGAAGGPGDAATLLRRLDDLRQEAHEELLREATAAAARWLAGRDAAFRAEVARSLPDGPRAALVRAWLDGRRTRDDRLALLEIAVRLHVSGAAAAALDSWARAELDGWGVSRSLESRLRHDTALLDGLREMTRPRRGRPWKREDV